MIRIDGSGRDGMEEERAFPLTYSPSFAFFLFLSFPIFSPSFFLHFFLKIFYLHVLRFQKDLHRMRL